MANRITPTPTPRRTIAGGRELRQYQGYWYIILTPAEMEQWPGCHWNGFVLFHKWKWWKKYGEWYAGNEMRYCYADGNRDNLRITNIDLRPVTQEY